MAAWYFERGPEADVVISSRVRLARNMKEFPFPSRMTDRQAQEAMLKVRQAAAPGKRDWGFVFTDLRDISAIEGQALVEKHLISPNLLEKDKSKGVIISEDERISIMINEEDHLRIQCLFPGMQIQNAWELCDKVDTMLEKSLEFAFNRDLGYLTCCPTNTGTGIRASVMLHLPALVMTGYIGRILEACGKLGMAVRGLYGENTEARGNIFQVSNQVTLGQSEEEIVEGVRNITSQIIEQERMMRGELYRQNPSRFEDRVFRSYGLLTNARILSSEEGMKLLSDVRLGVDMGIIKDIDSKALNEVMLMLQPANLQKAAGKVFSPEERDIRRAEMVKQKLRQ